MEHEQPEFLDVRDLLEIAWRHRRPIAALTFLAIVATGTFSLLSRPLYRASAEVLVEYPAVTGALGEALLGTNDVTTQARVVLSVQIAELVASDLGWPTDPDTVEGLIDQVSVAEVAGTSILTITATDTDPELAAQIPQTFAERYIDFGQAEVAQRIDAAKEDVDRQLAAAAADLASIDQQIASVPSDATAGERATLAVQRELAAAHIAALEEQATQLDVLTNASVVGQLLRPAVVPPARSSTGLVLRNVLFGLVAGLSIGFALAIVKDWLDDLIVRERQVQRLAGAPTLAWILRDAGESATVPYASASPSASGYHRMRAAILSGDADRNAVARAHPDGKGEVVSVTVAPVDPAAPGGVVAANLAVACARAGLSTVLVRGHLAEGVDTVLHLPETSAAAGLAEVLAGAEDPESCLLPSVEQHLRVLPVGPDEDAVSELLTPERVTALTNRLSQGADVIVFDAVAVDRRSDAVQFAAASTTTVLLAAWRRSTRTSLRQAAAGLATVNAAVAGVVLFGD